MTLSYVRSRIALAILLLPIAETALATNSCDSVQYKSGNYTFGDNYVKDAGAAEPCFEITGDGAVIDLNGYSISCNLAGGCQQAIKITADNVTVKNGTIDGTNDWTNAIQNGADAGTGVAYDLTVQDVVVDGADIGVFFPGKTTKFNVFKNIDIDCIGTFLVSMPAGAKIQQNYCDSDSDGITVRGPASGTPVLIERNFVTSANRGIDLNAGRGDIERNIISDSTTPIFYATSATETLLKNICDDTVECEQPDDSFSLNVDW